MNSVIKGASYVLVHTPDMVLYNGTTQTTERVVNPDSEYLKAVPEHLRSYEEAVSYWPNQTYIGNAHPDELAEIEFPYYDKKKEGAERYGKYGEIIMGGAFTGKSTTLDAPTTKTTGAILVTVEFPDLHGATMGILVCACGGSEERMREIASKMNAKVVSMCKCKQAIENKPGAPLKCLRPGNCPGQVKNNMQFKKDKCEYILIGNCSDCSNTVMASGPKMGLKVFHQTDHVMRTVGHPLYRSLKVSKEVSQDIDF